jgi:hypothetical protein
VDGDAWAEAGTMHIRRYTGLRKFGENTYKQAHTDE